MFVRKAALALALCLVLAIGVYTGYWFYARGIAGDLIANWAAQRRAEGYTVSWDSAPIGGYPLLLRTVLGNPRVARAERGWAWRGGAVAIEVQPWDLKRIRLEMRGPQNIALQWNGRPVTAAATAGEAVIVARLSDSGRLAGATAIVRKLRVAEAANASEADTFSAAEIWLEALLPDTPPTSHLDPALTLSLAATDIRLPAAAAGPLGRDAAKLHARAQIMGALADKGSTRAKIDAWRRDGGAVEITWLDAVWGPLGLRAKGTLTLDDKARPLGAFSADITGFAKTMDAFAAAGMMKKGPATLAKAGMALMAKTPKDGGPSVLTVPVTAQSGALFLGPVRILDLPPIRFPGSNPAPPG